MRDYIFYSVKIGIRKFFMAFSEKYLSILQYEFRKDMNFN